MLDKIFSIRLLHNVTDNLTQQLELMNVSCPPLPKNYVHVQDREKELGSLHPHTLLAVGNYGALLAAGGSHAEAAPLLREERAGWSETLGAAGPSPPAPSRGSAQARAEAPWPRAQARRT